MQYSKNFKMDPSYHPDDDLAYTFKSRLSAFLDYLPYMSPNPAEPDQEHMISIQRYKSESEFPPLFQICTLKDGTFKVQDLEENTHKFLLSKVLEKKDLNEVVNMIESGYTMCLHWGPDVIANYKFE